MVVQPGVNVRCEHRWDHPALPRLMDDPRDAYRFIVTIRLLGRVLAVIIRLLNHFTPGRVCV